MLLELNNFHAQGSEAKRIIQIADNEIDVYHHNNGTITLSVGERQYFISNVFDFLWLSALEDVSVTPFCNFWKVAYLMNDDGKTIRPFRPDFYNDHTPIGLDRIIDYKFMTRRWRDNLSLSNLIDEMERAVMLAYSRDPHLFFTEFSEESDGDDPDQWVERLIERAKDRILNGFVECYGKTAMFNSLEDYNTRRSAVGLVTMKVSEQDGVFKFESPFKS